MIVAITAQKGGVGKTTLAATMAAALTLKGKKVLLVDLDQQGSLSFVTGADTNGKTTLGLLTRENKAADIIQKLPVADIIPANKSLVSAEATLRETGGEYRLREGLEPVRAEYDYIILDCPPALNSLTINALTAADEVIIPTQADVLSIQGIAQLYESYKLVKKYTNRGLHIAGVLLTRHSGRAVIKRDLEAALRDKIAGMIKTKVYQTTIREGVAINEAQYLQQSIFQYAPRSKVAADYEAFVNEFLQDMEGRRT